MCRHILADPSPLACPAVAWRPWVLRHGRHACGSVMAREAGGVQKMSPGPGEAGTASLETLTVSITGSTVMRHEALLVQPQR